MKKFLVLFLVIVFTACSTMQYVTIKEPSKEDTSLENWHKFYTDQFRVFGYEVIPPDGTYPSEAKQAYQQAKTTHEEMQTTSNLYYILGGVTGGIFIAILIINSI